MHETSKIEEAHHLIISFPKSLILDVYLQCKHIRGRNNTQVNTFQNVNENIFARVGNAILRHLNIQKIQISIYNFFGRRKRMKHDMESRLRNVLWDGCSYFQMFSLLHSCASLNHLKEFTLTRLTSLRSDVTFIHHVM